jgi:hypothetical protein
VFVRSATPKKPRVPSPSVNSSMYLGGLRAGGTARNTTHGGADTAMVSLLAPRRHRRRASQAQHRAVRDAQQAPATAPHPEVSVAALAPETDGASDPDIALLILEGRASAAALIDSGTSNNIICAELAASLEAGGAVLVPVHRVIRGGGQVIGHSTHEVHLQVQREKGGEHTTTTEHFIVFTTGHDIILGAPLLKRWGWIDFSAIRRPAAIMAIAAVHSAAGSRAQPGFKAAKRKRQR